VVHVFCTGKSERERILASFDKGIDKGIDGVLVAGCLEGWRWVGDRRGGVQDAP
jgi:coenzyme F420-reducing hydrogenase delta subunit